MRGFACRSDCSATRAPVDAANIEQPLVHWKKIGLPGENRDGIPTLAPDINERRRKDNEQGETARSLKIGQSVFLMTTDPPGRGKGRLERYRVQGDTLEQYQILSGRAVDFLKTRHPDAKNIRGNTSEGTYAEGTGAR